MPEVVRRIEDGKWFWVQNEIVFGRLAHIKVTGFAVYCLLAATADRRQSSYPSNSYLARTSGLSRSTVKRALNRLERAGLISRAQSSRSRRRYYLLKTD